MPVWKRGEQRCLLLNRRALMNQRRDIHPPHMRPIGSHLYLSVGSRGGGRWGLLFTVTGAS